METKEEQMMSKRNMKLFSTYKKLATDYLFYYTVDFLFLTQIKHLSPADVVLASSLKALFGMFLQIPANVIIEFLGRRNSIIFANILNCIYMVMFMMTRNIYDLVFAKFVSSLAWAIKDVAEPSLLNASIPKSKYKSSIFAKIYAKGVSGYFIIGAISRMIAGFLFEINGYLPVICSLVVLAIVTLISICYIEPIKKEKTKISISNQFKDIGDGFKFVIKSERLKALILSAALIAALLNILTDYQTSLFNDLKLPAYLIGVLTAAISLSSAYASKKQESFHNKFNNKSIVVMALMASICTFLVGVLGANAANYTVLIIIIVLLFLVIRFSHGMYYAIMDRYIRNFTNKNIDTKIFAVKNLFVDIITAIVGIMASFLLDKMPTSYCMIIIGASFTLMYLLMYKYMKPKVGLKPEEYSTEERKYDELKDFENAK